MAGFSRNQWILIGVVIVAVALFGSVGYYFSTGGKFDKEGVQFETKFGLGGPGLGENPGHFPVSSVPYRPYCKSCGVKGTVHQIGLKKGIMKPYEQ